MWEDFNCKRRRLNDTIHSASDSNRLMSGDYINLRAVVPSRIPFEKNEALHIRGILLYGESGVDKESLALHIGQMLGVDKPKFVQCSTISSIFNDNGEVNYEHPLVEAEKDRSKDSIHVVVFNKLDYLFTRHGSWKKGKRFGHKFVDYMKSKLDGENRLNNILIIGITDRKDLIDPELLKDWCFTTSMEVPLPNSMERKRLLKTTMSKMKVLVTPEVRIKELVKLTKNYSGMEIEYVVLIASRNERLRYGSNHAHPLVISRIDLLDAIDKVHPVFGTNEQALQRLTSDMALFSSAASKLVPKCKEVVKEVRKSIRDYVHTLKYTVKSVLLYGPPGSGKSAIAASVALASKVPFVKLLSAANMKKMTEKQKIAHIEWVFSKALYSNPSIIVVDNIEKIIECRKNSHRHNKKLVALLRTKIFEELEPRWPLLVLVTSSRLDILKRLKMASCFTHSFFVDSVTSIKQLEYIMNYQCFLRPEERARVLTEIQKKIGSVKVSVGIKHILRIINVSRETENPGAEFIEAIVDAIKTNSYE